MNKYKIQKIKELIEVKSLEWAHNWIVSENPELKDSPKGKVEIESTKKRMETIEKELKFLNELLISQTKTKKA